MKQVKKIAFCVEENFKKSNNFKCGIIYSKGRFPAVLLFWVWGKPLR